MDIQNINMLLLSPPVQTPYVEKKKQKQVIVIYIPKPKTGTEILSI